MTFTPTPSFRIKFLQRSRALCALTLLGTLGACSAASYNTPAVHRPGPASTGYYGTHTPGELAFGRPTGLAPAQPITQVELDHYLKPLAPKAQPATRNADKGAAVAVATSVRSPQPARDPLAVNTPASAPPAPTAVPAASTQRAPVVVASASEAQRYASREAQSSKQQQYRGGDVLVISVSTVLIILLIVILILLLR